MLALIGFVGRRLGADDDHVVGTGLQRLRARTCPAGCAVGNGGDQSFLDHMLVFEEGVVFLVDFPNQRVWVMMNEIEKAVAVV